MHVITTVEETATSVTRECSCGWGTVGDLPNPTHHTPLAEREAKHLLDRARIEDGTIFDLIPASHEYWLHLRRRVNGEPNEIAITAVWVGGSQEVLIWPWTADGLAKAQKWCDKYRVCWSNTSIRVQPHQLAAHAR